MSGTLEGGKQAAKTNKARHGKDFYRRIGAKGGSNGRTGGFFANRELARTAGAVGGRISRRPKKIRTDAQQSGKEVGDGVIYSRSGQ